MLTLEVKCGSCLTSYQFRVATEVPHQVDARGVVILLAEIHKWEFSQGTEVSTLAFPKFIPS